MPKGHDHIGMFGIITFLKELSTYCVILLTALLTQRKLWHIHNVKLLLGHPVYPKQNFVRGWVQSGTQ